MRLALILCSRVGGFFRRRALDQQLDEELNFHLEMEAAANRKRGMPSDDARRAAQRAFGGAQQVKEIYREQRGLPMLELLLKDLLYAWRMIRRSPGFTSIAVLSLALGIGANTAIFTLIDAVMLRSLPVTSPEQLVTVGDASRPNGKSTGSPMLTIFSYPLYQRLSRQNTVFTGLAASGTGGPVDVSVGDSGPQRVRYRLVSGNYFEVLGIPAVLGRTFTGAEEGESSAGPAIVISYDYWTNRFARDPAILGRTLRLNGSVFEVAGVGPRGFTGDVVGNPADIWIPLPMQPQVNRGDPRLEDHNINWLLFIGRLKPGVSLGAARAEMTALALQAVAGLGRSALSADDLREMRRQGVAVEPGAKGFSALRKRVATPLVTLMTVVGLVLLVACANVANLLLARAAGRRKEISVRLAVGAGRGRLVRQLLTESVLLAAMGGAAGSLLALWGTGILLRLASDGKAPIALDVHPNATVLGFTAAVSLLTGLLFGLVPALRSTRVDLAPALRESTRSVSGSGWQLGKLLVVGQVALSLLLLVGAGLFIRSLVNLQHLDVGYSRANLVLLRADLAGSGYPAPQQLPTVRRMIERLSSIPGVRSVTVSENGIFSGTDSGASGLRVEGFTSDRKEDLSSSFDQVGPHYFQVVGVPLIAGRDFDDRDQPGSLSVAIINDTMARVYFAGRDPIGKYILNGGDRYSIVGVVKDMKERDLKGKAERRFFVPLFQSTDRFAAFNFEIRTYPDAAGMVASIRHELQAFDRNLKMTSLQPVTVLMDQSISEERLVAQLCGFFGVLALVLAATGLYGVMAYATSRRAGEIGLRMALGASRGTVTRMILRETIVLVAAGIAVGLPAALAATRLIATSLVGLSPADPATLAGAVLVMLMVAALAGLLPAARASRIDPMSALRQE